VIDIWVMFKCQMDIGAVAFMSKFRKAATVARRVMEYTTHTMLVGEGAEEFASMVGVPHQNTVTNESLGIYESWVDANCQPNFYQNLEGCQDSCGPYPPPKGLASSEHGAPSGPYPRKVSRKHMPWASKEEHDTIGMVAIDADGNMACGTTTNGASHKVPNHLIS
jgi:N4-(beta-N-acetylglucosaminyl)-L-asparaginase